MMDVQRAMSDLWRVFKEYRHKSLGKNKVKIIDQIYSLIEIMEAELNGN